MTQIVPSSVEPLIPSLPSNVEYCSKCVISNQRPLSAVEAKLDTSSPKPTINFENKTCRACAYNHYKYHVVDWTDREAQLVELLDKHRSSDGSFDVLVPGSGGKDSSYVSHILKYKYGMHPLTCTWAPHIYTDIGKDNFNSWLRSGFDNVLVTPNPAVHARLTRLAFLRILHPFQPFILGQKSLAPKIALKNNIKLIMYGESGAEGGSNLPWDNPLMPPQFYTREHSHYDDLSFSGFPSSQLIDEYGFSAHDLLPYIPLERSSAEESDLEVHFMSYYRRWVPQDNYYYSARNCNFKPNPVRSEGTFSRYSSLDDKIDGFHYYTTFIKFGIGRASYDASQEIRNGFISRNEALRLVELYDGEFPLRHFRTFLDYIQISESEFFERIDMFRSPDIWTQLSGQWDLKQKLC